MNSSGQTLACLVCLTPLIIGVLLGWVIRSRTLQHGWLGLLPNRLRQWIDDFKLRLRDE